MGIGFFGGWGIMVDDSDFEAMSDAYTKRQRDIDKWKAKQPEWIAIEMQNEEIVQLLKFINGGFVEYLLTQKKKEICCICGNDSIIVKIINGKLYKKVKNPKVYGERVISW